MKNKIANLLRKWADRLSPNDIKIEYSENEVKTLRAIRALSDNDWGDTKRKKFVKEMFVNSMLEVLKPIIVKHISEEETGFIFEFKYVDND